MQPDVLDQMEAEVDHPFKDDTPSTPLYHYTTSAGVLGILEGGNLRATHFRQLNDRQELRLGEDIAENECRKAAAEYRPGSHEQDLLLMAASSYPQLRLSETEVYVASLSEEQNLLSQWRAYGNNGGGYAIGFNEFSATGTKAYGVGLVKCIYDESVFRADIRAAVVEIAEAYTRYVTTYAQDEDDKRKIQVRALSVALRQIAGRVPKYKHPAFSEEREWRFVVITDDAKHHTHVQFRSGAKGVVSFLTLDMTTGGRLPLERLVVGPTQDPFTGLAEARLLLRKHGYDPARAVSSGIPFKG